MFRVSKGDRVAFLEQELPRIARQLVETNDRLPADWRQRFAADPDSMEEHEPCWHQWGIVTHSRKFREMYDGELQTLLRDWVMVWDVARHLAEEVDGKIKSELIRLAAPVHDLGKFRKGSKEKDGKVKSDFDGHDKLSQGILLGELRSELERLGLIESQISYVARCAGNHYELGFVREEAKRHPLGYTIAFIESPAFYEVVAARLEAFVGFEVEVGLLFLADSLAKTNIVISAVTDAEIDARTEWAKDEIASRGLNPKLIDAVRQRPVNIAVARRYLEMVL